MQATKKVIMKQKTGKETVMTEKEFEKLCTTTQPGTPLTFSDGEKEIRGTFVGCADDAVIIEAGGHNVIWPRELCDFSKSDYPTPSYS